MTKELKRLVTVLGRLQRALEVRDSAARTDLLGEDARRHDVIAIHEARILSFAVEDLLAVAKADGELSCKCAEASHE